MIKVKFNETNPIGFKKGSTAMVGIASAKEIVAKGWGEVIEDKKGKLKEATEEDKPEVK